MKKKKQPVENRNWGLVLIASILIVLGLAITVAAIVYIPVFGWYSLVIGISGLSMIAAAVVSIIENDPAWILLNLILPG